ncbi:MYG1 family protein [Patulibacter sp. SYSU D01012]|uniref:MYG1 family protein n=1 Tax=Patulibacter sp. SYSU D01012 TaxID=2817381 RepID=UPI001B306A8B|nr:MYG1 family protein [Patulibacter sp. SYSU D01012]
MDAPRDDAEAPTPLRVGTHSGSFHADEVFALATLRLARGPLEIVRSRDPQVLATCTLRVDVGRRYDPAGGDFDHHQGDVGERANGIRYASFGLVWKEHGREIAGSDEVAAAIDVQLVAPIDAGDNGQELYEPLVPGVTPHTVSGVIAAINPPWDTEDGARAEREAFDEAVDLAEGILRRELAGAQGRARAAGLVRAALERAEDPRVLVLDRGMPWKKIVVAEAPEVLFVVAPRTRDWSLQAVPAGEHGFANRKDLPAAWAGLEGEPLQQVTGVPDAVFCHGARFMAVAGSREGAMELVRQALADDAAAAVDPADVLSAD